METDWLLAQRFLESHPRDGALILDRLPTGQAATLLEKTPPQIAATVLQQMEPLSAAGCLARLAPERAALVLIVFPLDRAAGLLRRLEVGTCDRILAHAPPDHSLPLRRLLQYPEGTAGALMDPRAMALPGELSVSEALTRVRRSPENVLYYIYVVERDQRLAGVLNLRELMLASPKTMLASAMHRRVARLPARADLTSIVAHPGWRDFHALPVVDDSGAFVGVIRYETLRRLEEDATGGRPGNPAVSTMMSLGELCWIGFTGMLAGFATVFVKEQKETDHGSSG
jgi:magnesium transporter